MSRTWLAVFLEHVWYIFVPARSRQDVEGIKIEVLAVVRLNSSNFVGVSIKLHNLECMPVIHTAVKSVPFPWPKRMLPKTACIRVLVVFLTCHWTHSLLVLLSPSKTKQDPLAYLMHNLFLTAWTIGIPAHLTGQNLLDVESHVVLMRVWTLKKTLQGLYTILQALRPFKAQNSTILTSCNRRLVIETCIETLVSVKYTRASHCDTCVITCRIAQDEKEKNFRLAIEIALEA